MLEWFPHLEFNETNISVAIIFVTVVLYESRFKQPITFIFGDPKLFDGKKFKNPIKWGVLIFIVLQLFWRF